MNPVAGPLAAHHTAQDFDNYPDVNVLNAGQSSAVSWAAVSAGAVVAAALSLSLLALGTGLGFSAISPWSGQGASAATIGMASIVWLIVMQIIAAAMGGYLAGRLRTKWIDVHNDEVFFRDTAHGFLVWAAGLVITAAFLASAASTVIGGTVNAGSAAAGAAFTVGGAAVSAGADAQADDSSDGSLDYFVDALFRGERADLDTSDIRAEVARILTHGWLAGGGPEMQAADQTYLAGLIARQTGISQAEAGSRIDDLQARVADMEIQARQAADTAREAVVHLSLWMFLGLLIGAFSACYAATIGGHQRDNVSL